MWRRAWAVGSVMLALTAACSDPAAVEPINLFVWEVSYDGPGVVGLGDSVTIRISSRSIPAVPQWTLRVYLSSNNSISAEDTPIGDGVAVPVDPQNSFYADAVTTLRIRIPPATPAGLYYLGIIADPAGALPDSTREDNDRSTRLRLGVFTLPEIGAAPPLLGPTDGTSYDTTATVDLAWTAVAAATYYEVETNLCLAWTDDADPAASCRAWWIYFPFWTSATSNPTDFFRGVYRWQVRAVGAGGTAGPASPWRTFVVEH